MRRPLAMDGINFENVGKIASSKESPVVVNNQNTITLETKAIVGPLRNRTILLEKFQSYCPQDYDVHSGHMYEVGKEDFYGWDSDDIQIGSQEEFFDKNAPMLIEDHRRRKRTITCQTFGLSSNCHSVIEVRCGNSGEC